MKLSASPFWKHVITVLTGTVAAQALPLLAAPLITRLCTPEDLGAFSVWLGMIAIASVVATLRLEQAMILDHGLVEQQTCFSVVAYFATLLALIITLFGLIARAWGIPQALNMSWFGLLTIGIGMWLTAYMQTILAYATSYRAFGNAALAKVWGAGAIAFGQLSLLIVGLGGVALMAGQLIGLAIGLTAAIRLLSPPRASIATKPTDSQRKYLKKHQAFWRFALPADLLNTVAAQLPLFLIGAKHGVLAAGLFALTRRVMAAPCSLLAASIQEVFKREAAHEFQTLGNCKKVYERTFKALFLLGCGPTLFIFVFATDFFAWVFGEPWRAAGEFARILAPLYFLNFIASPLSYVFYVTGKQKFDLIWQVALLMMTITVFSAPLTLNESLWSYTIGYSSLYIIYLSLSYRFSQNRLVIA
jgi:O-antigen/teichoic acid export membrane protein